MTTDPHAEHNDLADLTELNFEQAYAKLETIVAQLESGDLPLDESVTLYAHGQALAKHCGTLLDTAELHIQQITADGEITTLD